MGKKVNKDYYTQKGSRPPKDQIDQDEEREALTRNQKRVATGEAAAPRGNHPEVQPTKDTLPSDRPAPKVRTVGDRDKDHDND